MFVLALWTIKEFFSEDHIFYTEHKGHGKNTYPFPTLGMKSPNTHFNFALNTDDYKYNKLWINYYSNLTMYLYQYSGY